MNFYIFFKALKIDEKVVRLDGRPSYNMNKIPNYSLYFIRIKYLCIL